MKKALIAIGAVIALVVAVVVVVVLNLNSVVKQGIEVAGPKVLGVPVTVDSVDLSILTGDGEITGLKVANPEGYKAPYALEFSHLAFGLDLASLSSDVIHIRRIVIDQPAITYEGDLRGGNLQQLQKNAAGSAGSSQTSKDNEAAGKRLVIDHFEIDDAKLGVHIRFLDKPLSLVVPKVEVNDIGKQSPATAAEVTSKVLGALNRAVIPLIRQNATGLESQVHKGLDKLKGLLKQ